MHDEMNCRNKGGRINTIKNPKNQVCFRMHKNVNICSCHDI